jgi:hypothetical protein
VKVLSDTTRIAVEMPEVVENGGSTLLNYELQADDGIQGDLETVYQGLNRTV